MVAKYLGVRCDRGISLDYRHLQRVNFSCRQAVESLTWIDAPFEDPVIV